MKCCQTCKYATPMVGALACMGQKGMPYVRPTDRCDSWKSAKQTNADKIRAMSDEELAEWIAGMSGLIQCRQINMAIEKWLDWLRREAKND